MTDEDARIIDALTKLLGDDKAFVLITTDTVRDVIGGDTSIRSNVSKDDYMFMLFHVIAGTRAEDERGPLQ